MTLIKIKGYEFNAIAVRDSFTIILLVRYALLEFLKTIFIWILNLLRLNEFLQVLPGILKDIGYISVIMVALSTLKTYMLFLRLLSLK